MDLEKLKTTYKDQILALAKNRKAEDVRVFGSMVRGDAQEHSDVDFLVHFKPDASLLDQSGLYGDLKELLGCDVDVVDDEAIKPRLRDRIVAEAVPL